MKKQLQIILFLLVLFSLLGWRAVRDLNDNLAETSKKPADLLWDLGIVSAEAKPLTDNRALYGDAADDSEVLPLYVVVLPTKTEDGENVTFSDLNAITDYRIAKPRLNAFTTADRQEALDFAAGSLSGNSTITLRGHSTLTSEKKSYKIRLNSETKAWQGQMTINLNKHPNDESRIRNKIAFDLLRLIPDLTSMQSRFVHLQVLDISVTADVDTFTDYGLFTQIEQGNELFLKTHGLDQNGNLYKANYFEFHAGLTQLKNVDDPNYDAAKFDEILGIGAGKNHLKLLQMIADVNNGALDIDKILDKHFCRDNYFAWLAFNILVGNYDTQTQNYYLYSPHDSLTWYFLPWDYDGSMVYRQLKDVDGNPAQLIGVANYWSNVLHSRVFRQAHNLNELNQKLDELYNILGKGAVDALVAKYQPLIEQYYLNNLGFSQEFTSAEFYENLDTIRAIVQHNYELYYASIEKPMPIFLGETEATTDGTRFFWSSSFDLQGDRISYTLQISKNSRFTDIVYTKSRLTATTFTVALEPGEYYWRVFVTDSKGERQRAFDVYWENAADRNIHTGIYGIRKISVK